MKKEVLVIEIVGLIAVAYVVPKPYTMLGVIAFFMIVMLPLWINEYKEEQAIRKRNADEEEAKEVATELFDWEEWDACVESAADELRAVQFEENRARKDDRKT